MLATNIAERLSSESLIRRLFRLEDRVEYLQYSPEAMFFYNIRAMAFVIAIIILMVLALLNFIRPAPAHSRVLLVLSVCWLIAVTWTLTFNLSLRKRISRWAESEIPQTLPPIIRYLQFDFALIVVLVLAGRVSHLDLNTFAFSLIGLAVVYGALVAGRRSTRSALLFFVVSVTIAVLLLYSSPRNQVAFEQADVFGMIVIFAPPAVTLLISTIFLMMLSGIRANEQWITQRQLILLGQYEALMTDIGGESSRRRQEGFRAGLTAMLENLCKQGSPFWYHSACLWLTELHQDRGEVLIPIVAINLEPRRHDEAYEDKSTFPLLSDSILLTSTKDLSWEFSKPPHPLKDGPAALIPLNRNGRQVGLLALFGVAGGPPLRRQERAFLQSLASIISNAKEQFDARNRTFVLAEMNSLFTCNSLADVFARVTRILTDYLMATGCQVIFRPDPRAKYMRVVAASGLATNVIGLEYSVGTGMTGKCAAVAKPIRFDDVASHRVGFDPIVLKRLETACGSAIRSWLAIPIGSRGHNHGVIKVINSASSGGWFTDEDQALGEDLALRLQVVIEKFLYIEGTEIANRELEQEAKRAKTYASAASQARENAERLAMQRQSDLMVITHQLQGPLVPIIGTLSAIQSLPLSPAVSAEIEYARALAEDCITLCWGINVAFANDAGVASAFPVDEIDAPAEMRRLCRMLTLTNPAERLTFSYKEDSDFPKLRMNRGVFTSVMFSLLHNAFKYAEDCSTVFLECGFERKTAEPALKVKSVGVPIYPHETEKIFERFQRGQALTGTSFKYSGTGLGLWVARELMRLTGGDVTVELSHLHPELSVFIVHIPKNELHTRENRPHERSVHEESPLVQF